MLQINYEILQKLVVWIYDGDESDSPKDDTQMVKNHLIFTLGTCKIWRLNLLKLFFCIEKLLMPEQI